MKRRTAPLAIGAVCTLAAAGLVAGALPAAAATSGCSVAYRVTQEFPGGFVSQILITNLGAPITGWTLTFDFPDSGQRITQGFSATWSQSGSRVSATSLNWNASLGTDSWAAIGTYGARTDANPVPTSFALNGTTCTSA